jgi:hypothetical protein
MLYNLHNADTILITGYSNTVTCIPLLIITVFLVLVFIILITFMVQVYKMNIQFKQVNPFLVHLETLKMGQASSPETLVSY